MTVELRAWSAEDLPVLERANTPEMTRLLGGPETPEQVMARHEKYLRLWRSGEAEMYRIDLDDEPVGAIGFWQAEHEGTHAYEAGWGVEPAWQGRGIAREALRLLIARVRERGDRQLLVAYPGAENAASNALCRTTGFIQGRTFTEPWRGGELTVTAWALDMSPLDLAGRIPDLDERFVDTLDREIWSPYYLPHWSSRDAASARWRTGPDGLELRIDEDTAPWAPEWDGEVRVAHLQTGQRSGPVGSADGQHRFREGLVVREQQPEQRLHLVRHGVIEVRLSAVRDPRALSALWPIGFEDAPERSGEICVCEIFGDEIDDDGGWVCVGVKAQHDPALRDAFEKVRVTGDLTTPHDYAVEWSPDRIRFFIDGRWVKTVAQAIDYPMQLMLDLYDLPRAPRAASTYPMRMRVERIRTFPAQPAA
ncbi:GNAT family N-acetyltransferase [Microbacterium sp. CIAB417]|uniref:GNAT family N-acetyltransferase n=1 Tax=Microbacterium sp. CIAB417 TaxID=2860287 RepID=UPI001FABA1DD|nr:GNAT family N-acetyltransferase [Microbacterium sp. CIAB417]